MLGEVTAAIAQKSFGKYRPIAELGRGGMATVYLAAATGPAGFSKLVVFKQLQAELANDPEFRDMFLDEARLAARLNHPHIVQTYEVADDDGQFLIVMEYLEGQPFSSVRLRLQKENRLDVADQVRVLVDLLDGLHAAHELKDYDGTPLNVVHRDVSPHNVFVTYTGDVKVVDFGIAKATTSSSKTRTGIIKGKLSYMAPEQAFGRAIDRRADLFAVGIMLWEALCKRRMWKNMPDQGIMHVLSTGEIPRVQEFAADLDPILERVCVRSLAAHAEDRYATALEMRAELLSYLEAHQLRPDPREFGERVGLAFAKERTKIQAVIEAQMRLASTLSETAYAANALPQIDVLVVTGTNAPHTGSYASEGSATHASGARPNVAPEQKKRLPIVLIVVVAIIVLVTVVVLVMKGDKLGVAPVASSPTAPHDTASAIVAPVPPTASPSATAITTAIPSTAKPKPKPQQIAKPIAKPSATPAPTLDIRMTR